MSQTSKYVAAALLAAAAISPARGMAAGTGASGATPPAAAEGDRVVHRRAVEAAIWGLPIVSVGAMRDAFFRDAGASYGDIVYLSKAADWRFQTATPNASSPYVYFNFNLSAGPVVLEVPAAIGAGLFGSVLDAWQVPLVDVGPEGEDAGKGGKYLLLPPGYEGPVPAGYLPVRSATNNGYGLLRVVPATSSEADLAKGMALVKQLRLHPLAQAANPPAQRFIDMSGKPFDGMVRFDESLYVQLAKMVSEEPVAPSDLVAMGQLRSLGIERGKEFAPDGALRSILRSAAAEAHAELVRTARDDVRLWKAGARWANTGAAVVGAKTGFTFRTQERLEVDARGVLYFMVYAPPARLGKASAYLTTWRDGAGAPLHGGNRYRLHVPAGVPVRQFWSVVVYDADSAGFIRESPRVGLDSYDPGVVRNADGSVDVHFGPTAPPGGAANWVYTAPGRSWFAMFRFYGPEKALFEKTWSLPDLVRE